METSYDKKSKLNRLTLKVMHSDFIVLQMEILIAEFGANQEERLVVLKRRVSLKMVNSEMPSWMAVCGGAVGGPSANSL